MNTVENEELFRTSFVESKNVLQNFDDINVENVLRITLDQIQRKCFPNSSRSLTGCSDERVDNETENVTLKEEIAALKRLNLFLTKKFCSPRILMPILCLSDKESD